MKKLRFYRSKIALLFLLPLIFCASTQGLGATRFHENPSAPWGADSDLAAAHCLSSQSKATQSSLPSLVCQKMIRFFQVYISPIDGPRSHYYPTSSQYALQAIQKYGVLTGIALGCDRLMRENGDTWVYPLTADYGMERKLDPVR